VEKYNFNREIDKEYAREVFNAAKEIFCDGIYVKCLMSHPCGWDFIDFSYMEDWGYDEIITTEQISDGIYNSHEYEDLTLLEILKEVGKDGWCFEISGTVNW